MQTSNLRKKVNRRRRRKRNIKRRMHRMPAKSPSSRKYYAVFSRTHAEIRVLTYLTLDGTEVKVTEVSMNPNIGEDHRSRFPDSQFIGRIQEFPI